jgi:hypothetical protein
MADESEVCSWVVDDNARTHVLNGTNKLMNAEENTIVAAWVAEHINNGRYLEMHEVIRAEDLCLLFMQAELKQSSTVTVVNVYLNQCKMKVKCIANRCNDINMDGGPDVPWSHDKVGSVLLPLQSREYVQKLDSVI